VHLLSFTFPAHPVRNDSQPIAHFVISMTGINGLPEPVQVQVIISRPKEIEETAIQEDVTGPAYQNDPSPYIHSVTTSLSEDNKQGLDNLAYWRNGPEASKVYIYNQALAQYLAQYKDSRRPIPTKEAK
jgi:hypothetical protein